MENKEKHQIIEFSDKSQEYNTRLIGFIKTIVAEYYKQPQDVYTIKSRKRETVSTKHCAVYFCMQNVKISQQACGKLFGLDHATVIYIVRKTKGYLEWDLSLKKDYDEIQSIIDSKGLTQAKSLNLDLDFYHIDLNNVASIKIDKSKSIVFAGWNQDEVERFKNLYFLGQTLEIKNHTGTGLYILEKNKNPNTNEPKNN